MEPNTISHVCKCGKTVTHPVGACSECDVLATLAVYCSNLSPYICNDCIEKKNKAFYDSRTFHCDLCKQEIRSPNIIEVRLVKPEEELLLHSFCQPCYEHCTKTFKGE